MKLDKQNEIDKTIQFWQKLFIDELNTQNKSSNTIKTYNRVLNEFKEFCYIEEVLSLKDVNKYFFNSYIDYLKQKGLSNNTINLHIATIKHFFKYISENNTDYIDILSNIDKIKKIKDNQKHKEIITFTSLEWERIYNELVRSLDKAKSYNRYTKPFALFLIYHTGMRADEVLHLKRESFEVEDDVYKIKIKGKGDKERFNYISIDVVEEYLDKLYKLQKKAGIENEYLFVTKQLNIMNYVNLLLYNHNLLKKLQITNPQKQGLHTYRHTFASRLVAQGVNMQIIKDWLGHSSILTTSMFYAKADEMAKKGVVNMGFLKKR